MHTGTLPAVVDDDGCCRDFKFKYAKFGDRAFVMTKHRRGGIAGHQLTANTSLKTFRGFDIEDAIHLDDGCRHVEEFMRKLADLTCPPLLQKASEVGMSHSATC